VAVYVSGIKFWIDWTSFTKLGTNNAPP
jgi:hypothetical protein